MARIIVPLGSLALMLMVAAMAVGLSLGDVQGEMLRLTELRSEIRSLEARFATDREQRLAALRAEEEVLAAALDWANWHRILGVASTLAVVLVNSIVVTYFIGTSRWCREVVEAYGMDLELARRSVALKRRTFPWSVMGVLAVGAVAVLGAMADPLASLDRDPAWVDYHLVAALAGMALVAWSFWVQWCNVAANHEAILRIMDEVEGRQ